LVKAVVFLDKIVVQLL